MSSGALPLRFQPGPPDEAALDEWLSRPGDGVSEALTAVGGDIIVLGAGGHIGPSMARMARRALDAAGSSAEVIAVSRFTDTRARRDLVDEGVRTVVADLAEPSSFAALPDAAAVYYLAATSTQIDGQEPETWWANASIPAWVTDRYRGVPTVVYSTGAVYSPTPLTHGGSVETDPTAPEGEYAQSVLARERIFTHAAENWKTPTTIFRLNYACELRAGVIADLAQRILGGEPVDVSVPAINVVWQGDVSSWALRSIELADVPPRVLNAAGPETFQVRRLAMLIADALDRGVVLTGIEESTALLSDAGACFDLYGYPTVPARRLIRWVAEWSDRSARRQARSARGSRARTAG